MTRLFAVECEPPWLVARFASCQRILSWSLNRPGFALSHQVVWLQVVDADLPLGVDPLALLERRLAAHGLAGAVGLMTARDIDRHHPARSGGEGHAVEALVTLGLTNGAVLDGKGYPVEVYPPPPPPTTIGTVNLLIAVAPPLTEAAMVETMSIATMARTAALLEDGGRLIGSGTDCVVVACPAEGEERIAYAGLHTRLGKAVTTAVFQATREARRVWESEMPAVVAASRRQPRRTPPAQ